MTPTPSIYVESALRSVGYAKHTCGYLPHSLRMTIVQFVNFIAPSFAEGFFKEKMVGLRDMLIEKGEYSPAK